MLFFLVKMFISKAKKDEDNKKKFKKSAMITVGLSALSFIFFIATADTVEEVDKGESAKVAVTSQDKEKVEPKKEPKEEPKKEPELTEEQKAELAQKENEERAASELKRKEAVEAKVKAEENRKKGEEARKAKEVADAKAEVERIAKEKADKRANAKTIPYAQLKKNPDRYAGDHVKYTGEIIQILEGKDITNIRLSVIKDSYGYSINDLVFVEYAGYTDFVDGDIVTVYGDIYGSYSYESQAGYNISLPGILAEEIVQ